MKKILEGTTISIGLALVILGITLSAYTWASSSFATKTEVKGVKDDISQMREQVFYIATHMGYKGEK